jgi:hypothetical protein
VPVEYVHTCSSLFQRAGQVIVYLLLTHFPLHLLLFARAHFSPGPVIPSYIPILIALHAAQSISVRKPLVHTYQQTAKPCGGCVRFVFSCGLRRDSGQETQLQGTGFRGIHRYRERRKQRGKKTIIDSGIRQGCGVSLGGGKQAVIDRKWERRPVAPDADWGVQQSASREARRRGTRRQSLASSTVTATCKPMRYCEICFRSA